MKCLKAKCIRQRRKRVCWVKDLVYKHCTASVEQQRYQQQQQSTNQIIQSAIHGAFRSINETDTLQMNRLSSLNAQLTESDFRYNTHTHKVLLYCSADCTYSPVFIVVDYVEDAIFHGDLFHSANTTEDERHFMAVESAHMAWE